MRVRALMCALSAVAVLGASTSSASASNAYVTPAGNMTFAGGASQFTFHTTGKTINCTTTSATAISVAGAMGTFPIRISSSFALTFRTCNVVGGPGATVSCAPPDGQVGLWYVDGPTASSLTPGHIGLMRCLAKVTGSACSVSFFMTSIPTSYDNTAPQRLRIPGTGESIYAAGSTCATLPNDPVVTFESAGGGAIVFSASPATVIVGV
jgi:hypothetical protein